MFNDVVLEIFTRLPAKSIVKFQAACKSTRSFLAQNFFLKNQWGNMFMKNDHGFFVTAPNSNLELHSVADGDDDASMYFGVSPESLEFLVNTEGVDACSNGLVCGKLKGEDQAPLFVCNPVTKSWLSLPLPDGCSADRCFKLVFECSRSDQDDFTLMIVMDDPDDWSPSHLVRIFSPEEGVWKEGGKINVGARGIFNSDRPLYDHYNGGVVYFMSNAGDYITKNDPFYWPYVVCYEIKNSVSRIVQIPKEARKGVHEDGCKLGISRWGSMNSSGRFKSMCLIKMRKTVFSVWVLLDLNSSKWRMVFKMPAWLMGLREPNLTVAGFTVMNGSMLVIATAERVYRYNLMGNPSTEAAEEICRHGCGTSVVFQPYSNTLRPCGEDAKPLPIRSNSSCGECSCKGLVVSVSHSSL